MMTHDRMYLRPMTADQRPRCRLLTNLRPPTNAQDYVFGDQFLAARRQVPCCSVFSLFNDTIFLLASLKKIPMEKIRCTVAARFMIHEFLFSMKFNPAPELFKPRISWEMGKARHQQSLSINFKLSNCSNFPFMSILSNQKIFQPTR